MVRGSFLAAVVATAVATPLAGQEQQPTVTVGGVVYAQYSYQLKDTANHVNNFDVLRAYINVVGRFPHGIYTRVTPDIYRTSDGSLGYRLKYAFVSWTPSGSPLSFKFGMNNTPFVEYEETLWDYRMQGTIAMDRNAYLSSSDLSFLIDGSWRNDGVSFSAGILNGENYNKTPGDQRKDLAGRLSVRLMSTDDPSRTGGLRLTGYGHYGKPTGGGTRQRYLGQVSYRSKLLTLAADLAVTKDSVTDPVSAEKKGRVISVFGVLRIPNSKVQMIARIDSFDPNTEAADDRTTRFIGGVAYQLTPNLRVLADLDHVSRTSPELEAFRSQALFQVMFTF